MAHGHQIRTSVLGAAMKPQAVVFVLLLLASSAGAQNPAQAPANQGTSTPSPDQAVITNQDVIGMLKAGLSPEIVAAKVKNSKCQCDTSPAALAELRAAAVPDRVILAMVESAAPTSQKQGPLDGNNTVVLLPVHGGDPMWLLNTPKGDSIEAVPKERLEQALKDGYTPLLSRELAQLLRSVFAQNEQLAKELNALASDYELLVGKYNRLAAVQSAPAYAPATPSPQTRADKSELLMQYMMLRSLMPQPSQPVPLQVFRPNLGNDIHCTSRTSGNQTYTDCR